MFLSFYLVVPANSHSPDAHAIYLLNLLLAFLQPKFDPSIQDDLMADEIEEGLDSSAPSPLPSQRDDEFRPFVRRLPEWQFWLVLSYRPPYFPLTPKIRLSSTRATLLAIFCTTSEVFDVPVYWPILVIYFFVLFALTMRRQIQCVLFFFYTYHFYAYTTPNRHMIKYKYVPFDIGRKTRYGAK